MELYQQQCRDLESKHKDMWNDIIDYRRREEDTNEEILTMANKIDICHENMFGKDMAIKSLNHDKSKLNT